MRYFIWKLELVSDILWLIVALSYETSKQSIFIHNSGNLLIFDRDSETKQVFLDTSKAFDKVWRDSAMFR